MYFVILVAPLLGHTSAASPPYKTPRNSAATSELRKTHVHTYLTVATLLAHYNNSHIQESMFRQTHGNTALDTLAYA